MDCQLPDNTMLKIGVYFKGMEKQVAGKAKKEEKLDVKPRAGTDLLSIFQKAIEGVEVVEPQPKVRHQKSTNSDFDIDLQPAKVQSQSYKLAPVKVPKYDK